MSKHNDFVNQLMHLSLNKSIELGLKEVERLARKILKRNKKSFTGFCMAMGHAFFYDENGSIDDNDPRVKELTDFIDEWNRYLYLTGNPMKLNSWDGELITDW